LIFLHPLNSNLLVPTSKLFLIYGLICFIIWYPKYIGIKKAPYETILSCDIREIPDVCDIREIPYVIELYIGNSFKIVWKIQTMAKNRIDCV